MEGSAVHQGQSVTDMWVVRHTRIRALLTNGANLHQLAEGA
jgi:hypothetical protein